MKIQNVASFETFFKRLCKRPSLLFKGEGGGGMLQASQRM